MAQEALEINLDELLNNSLMENHSCNILQVNNKKLNKHIKKQKDLIQKKINFNEETLFYDNILQNSKKAHSSLLIRARLEQKLKEKEKK
jgi:hypothetical protein